MNRYQSLTRMCLNNWHYINEKLLTFHDDINFFTGHSGSGKSTVLDALQIVLYADSNGRNFFNKAAKEDSDRTLMEYLRGMKVVQENNEASYLRNKNFSSTIVLEFKDTETMNYQSIGIVFDVDIQANDINHMFFRHKGELEPGLYRQDERTLSINELKELMKINYEAEDYYFSRTNEKFRNELYGSYFGGLHPKHFPSLFKRAIPFKMDIKLEEFVKNYICTENDIRIEDMQDSVAQYTRLKRRLEDTKNEIALLAEIEEQFIQYNTFLEQTLQYQYNMDKYDIQTIESKLKVFMDKQTEYTKDTALLEHTVKSLEEQLKGLRDQRDQVMISIENSGYDHLERELVSLNQMLELLYGNKSKYDKIAHRLKEWLDTNVIEPSAKLSIERFISYEADRKDMERIQSAVKETREEIQKDKDQWSAELLELKKQLGEITEQTGILSKGQKAYPPYLFKAKEFIAKELEQHFRKPVSVDILADLIEVGNENWLNAVEGYMGNNKLAIVVPPEYAGKAMEIYKDLDKKQFYKVSVLDTEKVLKEIKPALKNSLAEEVETDFDYVRAYVDFLMGSVIKCVDMKELRENKSGITPDCMLYQGYKLQHINPRGYTEYAYIGQSAVERRLVQLELKAFTIRSAMEPLNEQLKDANLLLSYETLPEDAESYEKLIKEIQTIPDKEKQKKEYADRIKELKERKLDEWLTEKQKLEGAIASINKEKDTGMVNLSTKNHEVENMKRQILEFSEELLQKQKVFTEDERREKSFNRFMEEFAGRRSEQLKGILFNKMQGSRGKAEEEYEALLNKRENYLKSYAYRGFSLTAKDNKEYSQLLNNLRSDKLTEFTEKANEQAKVAIYHFKTDFIYKIRDAIKEVMQQKEDLNRILAQLDFGKDKYKFIITKNRGEEGRFYDMFMDEDLEINPYQLNGQVENQMNLFAMHHEKNYGELINELIGLFMPPEDSDIKALEEARANMERYADYRTYLSFDMEQLVEGMPPMRLSRMLTKNSGGEGQNPLYVALLASFAQIYRINLKPTVRRRPTPRLVVLDEAFSKMDGEKVGSCIGLIRKLGFQAIISATNDKIQNYVDNVDKTFVFANPNKNRISIQEFERKEFDELLTVEGGEEDDTV
ncbi:chromosome segregation protein SMC [Anaerocolumna sedimenticola]|uniref:Chromosome segregation protein SMC n=1 Tax=Anaerocolumna sedimenticola TaxID=2696063 RepID=A0A6P1TIS9_9FIRM|nr:SbcC/MukB-like Walker B domain-containing protein [Anaerocolumna sedimenticola]QHQ61110.1 chromosome segregation protein SMC [Anaerocolumna sedimenticola]